MVFAFIFETLNVNNEYGAGLHAEAHSMNTALPLASLGQDKPSANEHQAWLRLGELGEQSVYDYQGEERISGCYQVQITLVCTLPCPSSPPCCNSP